MTWVKSKQSTESTSSSSHPGYPFWILAAPVLFLAGMAGGAFLSGIVGQGALSHLDFLFQTDFQMRMSDPFLGGFVSSAASSFLLMLFCYLCGMALWGMPLLPTAPILRGVGVGLIAGHLYTGYGMSGICFFLFVLLPGSLISSCGIFLAVQENWNFCRRIFQGEKVLPFLGRYTVHFGLFLIPCLVGAAADWLSAVICSSFFSF